MAPRVRAGKCHIFLKGDMVLRLEEVFSVASRNMLQRHTSKKQKIKYCDETFRAKKKNKSELNILMISHTLLVILVISVQIVSVQMPEGFFREVL